MRLSGFDLRLIFLLHTLNIFFIFSLRSLRFKTDCKYRCNTYTWKTKLIIDVAKIKNKISTLRQKMMTFTLH